MSKRDFKPLVEDMLEHLSDVFEYTSNHSFETFDQDKKTKAAVLRSLMVIGEAANRIPKEKRKEFALIEWERIIRTRNIIVHEYERTDYEIVWRIVTIYLPPLKNILEKILADLEP